MDKDKRFTIRIKHAEFEFLEKNLPPEIASVSELFRVGGKKFLEGGYESGTSLDVERIHELLSEIEQRLVSEIHQNRSLIVGTQSSIQVANEQESKQLKSAAINQLLRHWLSDPSLKRIKKLDDLERYIPYDHFDMVVLDTIKELQKRKLLTIKPSGALIWNL